MSCPLCKSEDTKTLYQLNFPCNEEINSLPNNYNILFCNECSLVYYSGNFSQKKYDYYYSNKSNYHNSFYINNSYESKNYYYEIISFVKDYIIKDEYILDIGCGSGILLECLYEHGFENLYGLDQSKGYSIIKNNNSSLNFIEGNIFIKNTELDKKFSLIILEGMLEHIVDLDIAIKNVSNMMLDGGYLYINVPDLTRYEKYKKTPFYYLHYEHILHFTYQSMENLCRLNGLEIIKSENTLYRDNTPMIRMLLRKNLNLKYEHLLNIHNEEIIKYMEEYISNSELSIKNGIIGELISSQEDIIVWGIGSSTLMLFSLGLEKCNIVSIVDSSSTKQENVLCGKKIIAPENINSNSTILVLPPVYKNSILNQIRNLGLKNKVLFLN
ncbi:class I SAM-dependent methyltransferase [Brachyspira alvinipulli]|uniref:class I SAM-dependent methyltransferase n=1 Tax=Brachyspira alvinipulli TaxID=84379 RepID=UPI00300461C9